MRTFFRLISVETIMLKRSISVSESIVSSGGNEKNNIITEGWRQQWWCECACSALKLINCNEVDVLELQDIRGPVSVSQPSQGQLLLGRTLLRSPLCISHCANPCGEMVVDWQLHLHLCTTVNLQVTPRTHRETDRWTWPHVNLFSCVQSWSQTERQQQVTEDKPHT